jgi:hypothetical protein
VEKITEDIYMAQIILVTEGHQVMGEGLNRITLIEGKARMKCTAQSNPKRVFKFRTEKKDYLSKY